MSGLLLAFLSLLPRPLGAAEVVLVEQGDEWRWTKGTAEPSPAPGFGLATTAWTQLDFDDSAWFTGPSGFGYGDGDDQTKLTDMRNRYWSVYIRRVFRVSDVASIASLYLAVDFDDGFVAYLNGTEIARRGLTGNPPRFNAKASGHEAGTFVFFDVPANRLTSGDNVLALQGHNTTLNSSDLTLIPRLIANPEFCPEPGDLTCSFDLAARTVELTWSADGVYDSAAIWRGDELLDGAIPGTDTRYTDTDPSEGEEETYRLVLTPTSGDPCEPIECSVLAPRDEDVLVREGDDWAFLRGTAAPPADWTAVDFDDSAWERGPTGIGYGDGDDQTVLRDMQRVTGGNPGYLAIFCRKRFELESLDPADGFTFFCKYDDGFVLWVNGQEVDRVNMPAGAITRTTAASRTANESAPPVQITIPTDLLLEEDNVLAVSVHNANLTSSDLTFIPSLVRRPDTSPPPVDLFRRGDITDDGKVNLTDAIRLLNHLFRGGTAPACADSGDVDDNGKLNLTDAIRLLNHLFRGAAPPPDPGLSCGVDPTADALGTCHGSGC